MLAYILAMAIGLGSVTIYMAAFFFPEVHRKSDFIWSGVGFFYALILWMCAGRITGAVLLGQTASVALLLWFGWQTLSLRRAVTPVAQRTPIPAKLQEQVTNLINKLDTPIPSKVAVSSPPVPIPESVVAETPVETPVVSTPEPEVVTTFAVLSEEPTQSVGEPVESVTVVEPEPVASVSEPVAPVEPLVEPEPVASVSEPVAPVAPVAEPDVVEVQATEETPSVAEVVKPPEPTEVVSGEPIPEQPDKINVETETGVVGKIGPKPPAKTKTPSTLSTFKGLSQLFQSFTGFLNKPKATPGKPTPPQTPVPPQPVSTDNIPSEPVATATSEDWGLDESEETTSPQSPVVGETAAEVEQPEVVIETPVVVQTQAEVEQPEVVIETAVVVQTQAEVEQPEVVIETPVVVQTQAKVEQPEVVIETPVAAEEEADEATQSKVTIVIETETPESVRIEVQREDAETSRISPFEEIKNTASQSETVTNEVLTELADQAEEPSPEFLEAEAIATNQESSEVSPEISPEPATEQTSPSPELMRPNPPKPKSKD